MLLLFLLAGVVAWAQSSSDGTPAASEAQSVPSDFPASLQDMDAVPDMDAVDLDAAPAADDTSSGSSQEPSRSLLEIGLHASGGLDTNPGGNLGSSSQLSSIGHFLASLSLLKIRHRSETAVDYLGGGTFWDGAGGTGHYNQQQFDAHQSIRWSRGQLMLRDSLRYMGEGDLARVSVAGSGTVDSFTTDSGDLPSEVSHQAYLTHVSSANLAEVLAGRFSAQVGASYSFTNYLEGGESAFDSRQASIIAAVNHRLSRKNTVGITYRFQNLEFPNSNVGHLVANSVLFTFHRTISGRMDFVAGAGPELVTTGGGKGPGTSQINASAEASLLYRWKRSGASVAYSRVVASGADVYAGSNDNIISASAFRDIFRSWRAAVDVGYTQASGINLISATNLGSSYRYVTVGATVRHRFGSALSGFASYQFNNESFGSCSGLSACANQTRRHSALIGVDWSIRRIPLD